MSIPVSRKAHQAQLPATPFFRTTTDLEFYELRYSGKAAQFLRGFRAIYLGVFFNIVIMATVSLAAIKIGGVMLGLSPEKVLLYAGTITVLYSALGGLRAVIFTDLVQFIIAMGGSIAATIYLLDLPDVGGLAGLWESSAVMAKRDFIPDLSDTETMIPLLFIPLAVQWWSTWYPGSEPGGGGYVAQRMLAARNGNDAMKATLFFNFAHIALRPWPWILVALCSLLVFPDLASLSAAYPDIPLDKVKHDLAYPAMLALLPAGLLGLVIASLASAYMSTISTHLNWGSSYIVNDVYVRFIAPDSSPRTQVLIGRLSTVILMLLASGLALYLESAMEGFNLLLQIGAGTGAIFILRWFWHRVNAWTEISGMVISLLVAIGMTLLPKDSLADHEKLVIGVLVTTVGWLLVTLLTRPEPLEKLQSFCRKIRPRGAGWAPVWASMEGEELTSPDPPLARQILSMFLGTITIYAALFSAGFLLYGQHVQGMLALAVFLLFGLALWKNVKA